jgi:hypothetical protein
VAYLGNLGGTFQSDVASLTRLATSAPFAQYLQEQIFLQSRMIRSGIIATNPGLTATTGTRIEAPFFKPLNPVEERMTSSDDWGTSGEGHFTFQKIQASTQYATITPRGFAYAVDKLTRLAIGEDPMVVLSSQLAPAMDKLRTAKFISQMEGLLGTGGPLNATNNLNKSVTTGAGEANYLTAGNVIEARYKLNERQSEITTIVMHSLVAAYLEQIGQLTFYPAGNLASGQNIAFGAGGVNIRDTSIGYFAGLQVVVDDQCPIIGTSGQQRQFVCYLAGSGVMQEGDQIPMEIEPDRNAPSKQDGIIIDYHHVQHIPGTSWNANFDNPTNAQLATGANFSLVYGDARLIPAVRLLVNSPYGGTIA